MNLRGLWDQVRAYYASRSKNDQRVILGLLGATVVSVLYLMVWVPVRDYRDRIVAEIEQGQQDVERSARFLGSADALRADRDALKKKLDAAKKELLPGNSGTLGAAALQEKANAAATEKGVSVQSTQVMKEEPVEPFRRVAIRMTLSSELRPLADLISTLEYTHHLVLPFVEISRRGAVAAGAKGPRTLQATIEVSGFVMGEGAKETDAADPGAAEVPAPVEEGPLPAEGPPPPPPTLPGGMLPVPLPNPAPLPTLPAPTAPPATAVPPPPVGGK